MEEKLAEDSVDHLSQDMRDALTYHSEPGPGKYTIARTKAMDT